ncbi:MAG TPA: class I SAM-dependent methyltransferase [Hyphomicrobiaceae bacterium]|jgi:2-polyprenyl-3-methyl-5-hydroxy-6-metoxy-1,4-benzoquinol methylase
MSALPKEEGVPFDAARSEAFAERFLKALNESAMVLMTSLGHRTGLFDALDGAAPLTSEELARKAGLNERYVREWLAVMVMSHVVEYEPRSQRYRLPPEYAAFLTRASVPNNLAATAQYISGIGSVETQLAECMRKGGGLPYTAYHRFHEVMAEDSGQTVVAALFDAILPLVPGLTERLEAGISVADVGCGAGRAMIALAEHFPKSRFTGFDLCEEPIETANRQVRTKALTNISFEQRDLSRRPLEGPFDLITAFDAVHDQRDPAGLLRSIHDALAPTGVFLMQDIAGSSHLEKNFDHPVAALLYAVSTAHCTCVSLGQGGPGLGTMWGEELAEKMLREAGFGEITRERLPHDFMNVYFIARHRQ